MARIFIKRKDAPLIVGNEIAKKVKISWTDETVPRDKFLSIGSLWAGTYGDIKDVELDIEKKPEKPVPIISPEEKERIIAKGRAYLNTLKGL